VHLNLYKYYILILYIYICCKLYYVFIIYINGYGTIWLSNEQYIIIIYNNKQILQIKIKYIHTHSSSRRHMSVTYRIYHHHVSSGLTLDYVHVQISHYYVFTKNTAQRIDWYLIKKIRLVSCYNELLLSWIIVRDYRVLKVDCCCSDSQRSIDVYTGYDRIQDNKNATTAVFFTNKYLNKQL